VAIAPNIPRLHHYIPQGYLRGFGWKEGKKNWYVYAADLEGERTFKTNTKNICAERDFLRVDLEGVPQDKIEKDMSRFEADARNAILRIDKSKSFKGDDRSTVLNLMALLAVRSPRMRENIRDFHERVMKMTMSVTLATKERWESQIAQAKASGQTFATEGSYEDIKEFHESGQYSINVAREFLIGLELDSFRTVLDLLVARKWRLYYSGRLGGSFVTSDRPVGLIWLNPEQVPPFQRASPGFGMINTEVTFPLTSNCFLIGRFEGIEDGSEEAHPRTIGACNTRTILHWPNYVISNDRTISYRSPGGANHVDDKFVERFKEFRSSVMPSDGETVEWNIQEGPPHPRAHS
jgi:hypothetical protein